MRHGAAPQGQHHCWHGIPESGSQPMKTWTVISEGTSAAGAAMARPAAAATASSAACAAWPATAAVLSTAPRFTPATSTPETVPPLESVMFAALSTRSAAMLISPDERRPASPAFTIPRGAIRYAEADGASGVDLIVPIPAPDTKPFKLMVCRPLGANWTVSGVKSTVVLAPRPASRSLFDDHITMSPPCTVRIRL